MAPAFWKFGPKTSAPEVITRFEIASLYKVSVPPFICKVPGPLVTAATRLLKLPELSVRVDPACATREPSISPPPFNTRLPCCTVMVPVLIKPT